ALFARSPDGGGEAADAATTAACPGLRDRPRGCRRRDDSRATRAEWSEQGLGDGRELLEPRASLSRQLEAGWLGLLEWAVPEHALAHDRPPDADMRRWIVPAARAAW